ncbi:MAG: NifB/NifX family molybdenum-iron cluster-binding protein [Candidatus Bathyarchaeota archaeon]|jgi:predicted Fe-Mo cluster-binding NifX family protein
MVKIVIPVSDKEGERLSAHFGRAPYFAWFRIDGGKIVEKGLIPNDSEHFGGVGLPPERIASLEPDVVITTGMGIRAINRFQRMRVAVLQARSEFSKENLDLFVRGELTELTEGCLHARHT